MPMAVKSGSILVACVITGALAIVMSTNAFADEMALRTPGTTFRECLNCPLMIVIPAGHFTMGSPVMDANSQDGRVGPPHEIRIEHPFAMGVYDVTVSEYARFVLETGHPVTGGCDYYDGKRWRVDLKRDWSHPGFAQSGRSPVVCVSFNDAEDYVRWVNGKIRRPASGRSLNLYRLPTEAEWEYVARAGTMTPYYWGRQASHDYANYGLDQCWPCGVSKSGKDRWDYTSPVGSFAPNAFGLHDISGNVWQWTEDCMHDSFVDAPADGSAWVGGECHDRVLRGGSWLDPSKYLEITVRNPWPADEHNYANGFRVARD
jgi:formylglycine-generating enzyme required for sulfatase activity